MGTYMIKRKFASFCMQCLDLMLHAGYTIRMHCLDLMLHADYTIRMQCLDLMLHAGYTIRMQCLDLMLHAGYTILMSFCVCRFAGFFSWVICAPWLTGIKA
jgi:hypothetical protein